MRRWFRSLHAQLFLWAVLPITFVIIALSFTGVYAHQRTMRDFVVERDAVLARLIARTVEDALAHGLVGLDGRELPAWIAQMASDYPGETLIANGQGRVLVSTDSGREGADLSADPGVDAALARRPGAVIVPTEERGPMLVAFAPVSGSDWVVLVREPVESLLGPILRLSSLAPAVAVGAGVVSLLVFTFGWRTIVHPLQRLSRAAEQVSWGDHAAIVESVGGVQEVRDLHQALTEMVERIRAYEAGIRDYLGAVTEGQEVERTRLAQELHDGPVQDLIALAQRAEMGRRLVERGEAEPALALLEETRQAELATVEELRRIIGALRPVYLEDLGFLPALEMLVRQVSERTAAHVKLETGGAVRRFAPDVELAAYRIAQEALNNAVQHAQAQEIVIDVRGDAAGLTLSIVDNGLGFALPPGPDVLTQAGHFGLVGMKERVTRLGGTFQVNAAPGAGTQITVRLPVQVAA